MKAIIEKMIDILILEDDIIKACWMKYRAKII
jgi:hypothetical protein